MKFTLKIAPQVTPEVRHDIEDVLAKHGFDVIGGGQTVNPTDPVYSQSDISFERVSERTSKKSKRKSKKVRVKPKDLVLLKDIVIRKGTILKDFSGKTEYIGDGHFGAILSLTDDSYGHFIYSFDERDPEKEELEKWFTTVKY